mmetsp:Transcript_4006/g.8638  ORF Transcript_4006/g.8638 Transcript_4006/m.8638 type:complete len:223 (-) Transcript_4006:126-794(-)
MSSPAGAAAFLVPTPPWPEALRPLWTHCLPSVAATARTPALQPCAHPGQRPWHMPTVRATVRIRILQRCAPDFLLTIGPAIACTPAPSLLPLCAPRPTPPEIADARAVQPGETFPPRPQPLQRAPTAHANALTRHAKRPSPGHSHPSYPPPASLSSQLFRCYVADPPTAPPPQTPLHSPPPSPHSLLYARRLLTSLSLCCGMCGPRSCAQSLRDRVLARRRP